MPEIAFFDCSNPLSLLENAIKVEEINPDEEDELFENVESSSSSQSPITLSPLPTSQFECDICFKTFSRFRYITEHMKRSHKLSRRKCPECDRPYNNNASLRKHLLEVHDYEADHTREFLSIKSGFFKCRRCDKSFDLRAQLNEHHEKDHKIAEANPNPKRKPKQKDEILDAETINKIFYDYLETYEEPAKPEDQKSHLNDVCHKNTPFKRNLSEHMRNNNQDGKFSCPECKKSYPLKRALLNHLKVQHPHYKGIELQQKAAYNCDICGEGLAKETDYKHHMNSHVIEIQYPCPICKSGSFSRDGLMSHRRNYHLLKLKKPTISCPESECKFLCYSASALLSHSHVHFKPSFQCPHCPKALKRGDLLKQHIKRAHNSSQVEYKCPYSNCSSTFKILKSFEFHLQTHKTNYEMKFECPVCLKKFNKKSNFKYHIKTHENRERCFPCSECEMSFLSDKLRHNHFQNIHIQKELKIKIECSEPECNETFISKTHLKNHVKSRHNRQFECSLCRKTYGFKYLLKRHMHNAHQQTIE